MIKKSHLIPALITQVHPPPFVNDNLLIIIHKKQISINLYYIPFFNVF